MEETLVQHVITFGPPAILILVGGYYCWKLGMVLSRAGRGAPREPRGSRNTIVGNVECVFQGDDNTVVGGGVNLTRPTIIGKGANADPGGIAIGYMATAAGQYKRQSDR